MNLQNEERCGSVSVACIHAHQRAPTWEASGKQVAGCLTCARQLFLSVCVTLALPSACSTELMYSGHGSHLGLMQEGYHCKIFHLSALSFLNIVLVFMFIAS